MNQGLRESSNNSFYNDDSAAYDQLRWQTKGGAYTNQSQQEILKQLCGGWEKSRILEVGSGTGRFTLPLLRRGNTMTLADVSAGMLSTIRKNIEAAGLADQVHDYRECSIYDLPFEDESFEHALSLNVFNHLERPDIALKELGRVTKRGSTLVFNYANLYSYYWPAARRINRQNKAVGVDVYSSWVTPRAMRDAIANAGLKLERLVGHVHMPRGLEPYPVSRLIECLDRVSRNTPWKALAPFHFCLLSKP